MASSDPVPASGIAPVDRFARIEPGVAATLVTLCAFVAAVGEAAPTGRPRVDVVWRVALVLATAALGGRARPWAWLLVAATVAAAAGGIGLAAGFGALVVTLAAVGLDRTGPWAGRVVGAGAGAATLHLAWPDPFGRSALVGAAAVAVLAASAARASGLRATLAGLALVVVAGIAVAVPAAALTRERRTVLDAVDAGQAGLDAARAGDAAGAATHFGAATELLERARRPGRAWWSAPARALPIASQHLRALDDVLATATEVAVSGTHTARAADLDRLRVRDGGLDLAALTSFAAPLGDLTTSLAEAHRTLDRTDSPWLADAATARIGDFDDRVRQALGDARRARRAVETLPDLLGARGRRRYLLAVMTPAELRGAGGMMGNWGILTAADGRIGLERFGRVAELFRDEPFQLHVDADYDARYVQGWHLFRSPQNLTASPDLRADASIAAQVLEQDGLGPIDGMIAVDPYFLAALLRITGPVTVAGWPEPFTEANTPETLLFTQYAHSDDPERPELLNRVTRAVFDRLTHGALPAANELVDDLGPQVTSHHVQMTSFHPEDRAFLEELGLDRALARPDLDALHVVTESAASTKVAWFLRRSVRYDATVDPRTGATSATVAVTLHNTAPTSGLSTSYQDDFNHLRRGADIQVVTISTPLEAVGVTVDGQVVEPGRAVEGGLNVFDQFVTLQPGGSATVTFTLEGRLPIGGGAYRIDLRRQPTVAPDDVVVRVNGRTLFDGHQDRDLVLRSRLRKS
ncbi:MAG: hypothetical protein JWN67_5241 [Actinomycetia bacterium]|nr:hypothetical protein [Actinomycetes bacterium]